MFFAVIARRRLSRQTGIRAVRGQPAGFVIFAQRQNMQQIQMLTLYAQAFDSGHRNVA